MFVPGLTHTNAHLEQCIGTTIVALTIHGPTIAASITALLSMIISSGSKAPPPWSWVLSRLYPSHMAVPGTFWALVIFAASSSGVMHTGFCRPVWHGTYPDYCLCRVRFLQNIVQAFRRFRQLINQLKNPHTTWAPTAFVWCL